MPTQKRFPLPDGRKVYAKIRVLDGAILSRAAHWPNIEDDAPILGDDGSTKYLPVMEDAEPVEYDSDLFFVTSTEEATADAFLMKRELTKRSKEELKVRAKNYEALHRSEFVPAQEVSGLSIIGLAILLKYAKNVTPTPEEEGYINSIVETAAKLQANNAVLAQINEQIEAGQEPDLKTPWEKKL